MSDASDKPKATYAPVHTRRAFEEVTDQIRGQIARGALGPGDRLPSERDLAEQFSLSRNTVREALRALEIAGILELKKGATGGAFVREGQGDAVVSSFADLFYLGKIQPTHLTEARMIVAVSVARLACQRATEEELDELEANVNASKLAVAQGDIPERTRINLQFHRILAKCTRNPVLIIISDAMIEIQRQMLEVLPGAPNSAIMPSRERLLGYLRARDEDMAALEMESNLRLLQQHYLTEQSGKTAP
ncbi:MAG: FadR family transcriptional regulator [Pseudorhodobacter sp.]|jgi:GntR family transcriptional repressor for pyruvate dehydrogenase complex|nr:MAG: FadR family transcriptional regulator [Pseudorhodobacter sp.]